MQAFTKIAIAENVEVILGGKWDYTISKESLKSLENIASQKSKKIKIFLDESFDLDFCGGGFLLAWQEKVKNKNTILENNLQSYPKASRIFAILNDKQEVKKEKFTQDIIRINKDSLKIINNFSKKFLEIFSFLGEIIYYFFYGIVCPKSIRIRALVYHIQEAIIKAAGISALACFLIGIVIVYQGSIQLRQFGASILIVEMSAMLNLREMAPMITAIIIAGRSASAFSAEIGMMRATEEIDAMKVMGFNPFSFLVLPRMLALCLAFPLIVFISDIFSILGSMLIASLLLGIGTEQFMERFLEMVETRHFWVGMIKAPFFGVIISLIGCYHGFVVAKDTRSIGIHTTKSVVQAIFCVIVFDAICSIIFTNIGL